MFIIPGLLAGTKVCCRLSA